MRGVALHTLSLVVRVGGCEVNSQMPWLIVLAAVSITISRRAILIAAPPVLINARRPACAAEGAGLNYIDGSGFSIGLPPNYYIPKGGRPRTGAFDDTVLVAANYASGRVAAVSRTSCEALLRDAGEPEALVGPLSALNELGRPAKVAALLAHRRDGDPTNMLSQPRSRILSSSRDESGRELRFVFSEQTFTATSVTTAAPTARIVQARSIFMPASDQGPAMLLTVWAGSASSLQCKPQPCEIEGGSLRFDCPAPVCDVGGELPLDGTDRAIVESFRVAVNRARPDRRV